GIDVANTDDIVLYDTVLPSDTDVILQKAGRIRDGRERDSRVVVYLPKNAAEVAQSAVEAGDLGAGRGAKAAGVKGKARSQMNIDLGVARLILAPCKVDILNELYGNPRDERCCTCPSCRRKPPVTRPSDCSCSGCVPEAIPQMSEERTLPTQEKKPRVPAAQAVTRKMRGLAEDRLKVFRKALRATSSVEQFELPCLIGGTNLALVRTPLSKCKM
ncbi:hypothetical protein OH77DRAFT_1566581, partial [Trametes cingulata]